MFLYQVKTILLNNNSWLESTHTPIKEAFDMAISALMHSDVSSNKPEIVRCKYCVNWIPGCITDQDEFIPPKCGRWHQMVGHSGDDYCSFAERSKLRYQMEENQDG